MADPYLLLTIKVLERKLARQALMLGEIEFKYHTAKKIAASLYLKSNHRVFDYERLNIVTRN